MQIAQPSSEDSSPTVLRGHRGRVRSVAFSPNGRVASASDDQCVIVWHHSLPEPELVLHHGGWVRGVAYSPTDDLLATASGDRLVRVWNLSTGEKQCLGGHADGVNAVSFSPDGNKLASVSGDGTLRVWDVATGRVDLVLKGHSGGVNAVAFSNAGILASASDDTTVRIWDRTTSKPIRVHSHENAVKSLCFSVRGDIISAGDRYLQVWNQVMKKPRVVILDANSAFIAHGVAVSEAGMIAAGYADGAVRIFDPESLRLSKIWYGHSGAINSIAMSLQQDFLVSGSDDGTVRLWQYNIAEASGLLSTPPSPSQGPRLVSQQTGNELSLLKPRQFDWANSVSFGRGGGTVAVAFNDAKVRVWDVSAEAVVSTLCGHTGGVNNVDFSPDGAELASASDDGSVRIWDSTTWHAKRVLRGHSGWVRKSVFSRDGAKLASASADATARVWDATTGHTVLTLVGHSAGLRGVAFSSDTTQLATASNDSTLRLWNAATGLETSVLGEQTSAVTAICWANGRNGYLASGLENGLILGWDTEKRRVIQTFEGHTGTVRGLVSSRDGIWLVSASVDTRIRIWDVSLAKTLAVLQGHIAAVRSVAFSPDDHTIASASSDGTVRVWDLRLGKVVKILGAVLED